MTSKKEFLTRVKYLGGMETLPETEKACRAVFQAMRELTQSEELEDLVSEMLELSPEIRDMWDNPDPESIRIPEYAEISDQDVVTEGHEPEETAIATDGKRETVKI